MESFYQRANPGTHSPNTKVMPVVEVRSNSFRDVSNPFRFNVTFLTTSTSSKVLECFTSSNTFVHHCSSFTLCNEIALFLHQLKDAHYLKLR